MPKYDLSSRDRKMLQLQQMQENDLRQQQIDQQGAAQQQGAAALQQRNMFDTLGQLYGLQYKQDMAPLEQDVLRSQIKQNDAQTGFYNREQKDPNKLGPREIAQLVIAGAMDKSALETVAPELYAPQRAREQKAIRDRFGGQEHLARQAPLTPADEADIMTNWGPQNLEYLKSLFKGQERIATPLPPGTAPAYSGMAMTQELNAPPKKRKLSQLPIY